jgi:hypothetical protein
VEKNIGDKMFKKQTEKNPNFTIIIGNPLHYYPSYVFNRGEFVRAINKQYALQKSCQCPNHNNSAALDDFELKFCQIANSIMLFCVRIIISSMHLALIQKREFTFMKVVNIHYIMTPLHVHIQ